MALLEEYRCILTGANRGGEFGPLDLRYSMDLDVIEARRVPLIGGCVVSALTNTMSVGARFQYRPASQSLFASLPSSVWRLAQTGRIPN